MRKRTPDNARFQKTFTEEILIKSLAEALKHASVQAVEVAEIAGCSVRYAKDLLNEMAAKGLIDSEIIGNVRTYRLKK